MKRSRLIACGLAALALSLWWRNRAAPDAASPSASADTAAASVDAASRSPSSRLADERSSLADALNSATTDIHADLRVIAQIVDTFRSNLPREGNPVGNNAEITAALAGRNQLRLSLIPADHPAIDARGELCDRWGTPFFFHAESATRMEIRSAGPDRRLWTTDDIATSP